MSIEAKNKKDDLKKDLPVIHTKNGTYVFNPKLIYRSLLRETSFHFHFLLLSKITSRRGIIHFELS